MLLRRHWDRSYEKVCVRFSVQFSCSASSFTSYYYVPGLTKNIISNFILFIISRHFIHCLSKLEIFGNLKIVYKKRLHLQISPRIIEAQKIWVFFHILNILLFTQAWKQFSILLEWKKNTIHFLLCGWELCKGSK